MFQGILRRIAIAVGAALVAAVTITPSAMADASATVVGNSTYEYVNVRSGPGKSTKLDRIDGGVEISLHCYKKGSKVVGPYTSRLWYKLADRDGWVSDAHLYTGTSDPVTPECVSSSSPPLGGWVTWNAASGGRDGGECTYLVYEKAAERLDGFYPEFYGNASEWADSARVGGWKVSDNPKKNTIVVFQPGVHGSAWTGHVAWVTRVTTKSGRATIDVVEMNWEGRGVVSTRKKIEHLEGMEYIHIP